MTEEKPHINPEQLRKYGVPEEAIKEAQKREERGLLDVRPSEDLVERKLGSWI